MIVLSSLGRPSFCGFGCFDAAFSTRSDYRPVRTQYSYTNPPGSNRIPSTQNSVFHSKNKPRSFQSILATLRADSCMSVLAGKHQGVEKGGRSLLAKVRKLQEDLEVVSLTMDRRVAEVDNSCACARVVGLYYVACF